MGIFLKIKARLFGKKDIRVYKFDSEEEIRIPKKGTIEVREIDGCEFYQLNGEVRNRVVTGDGTKTEYLYYVRVRYIKK